MSLCGDNHQKLIHRLNRIQGQLNGVKNMIETDQKCMDVLKQIAAAHGALRSLGMVVLENHLKGCVSESMQGNQASNSQLNSQELIDDVISLFHKFSR
jgi:DNA-binding FrmR family transcriptional regulator